MTNSEPSTFLLSMLRHARRVVVFVVGSTVVLIGVAMIVLPGPAVIVIPLGLTILATEFVWAKRWLAYAKQQIASLASQVEKYGTSQAGESEQRGNNCHHEK